MLLPPGRDAFAEGDCFTHSVQFGLHSEANGILPGNATLLRKLRYQFRGRVVLDVERHWSVSREIRISIDRYLDIRAQGLRHERRRHDPGFRRAGWGCTLLAGKKAWNRKKSLHLLRR